MTPRWRRRASCRDRVAGEDWPRNGSRSAETSDIEAGTLEGGEQGLFGAAEKVEALEVSAFDRTGLGETVERPNASREVVQTGEVFEVAAIAA